MQILLVDDDKRFTDFLSAQLRARNTDLVTTVAASCEAALDLVTKNKDIKLIILDLRFENISGQVGLQGLEALRYLREQLPEVPVAILSGHFERKDVVDALDKGAMGYIQKTAKIPLMLAAIETVAYGGVSLPRNIFEVIGNGYRPRSDFPQLKRRDWQVLACLVQGFAADRIIARKLGMGEGNVGNRLQRIFETFGVHRRVELIIKVFELRIDLRDVSLEYDIHDDES